MNQTVKFMELCKLEHKLFVACENNNYDMVQHILSHENYSLINHFPSLNYCIHQNKLDIAQLFIQHPTHPFDIYSHNGYFLLHAALEQTELIDFFVQHGASFHFEKSNIDYLDLAIKRKKEASVKALLQHGLKANEAHLLRAIHFNQYDIVELLWDAGLRLHEHEDKESDLIYSAINLDKSSLLEKIICETQVDFKISQFIGHACRQGYIDVVETLLKYGVDIHIDNSQSVKAACDYGHLKLVQYLVEKKHVSIDFILNCHNVQSYYYNQQIKPWADSYYFSMILDKNLVKSDIQSKNIKKSKI